MMVTSVSDGDFGNLALVDVIYDVRSKLRSFSNISVRCVSRGSNCLADGLAKRGSALEGENVVWNVF